MSTRVFVTFTASLIIILISIIIAIQLPTISIIVRVIHSTACPPVALVALALSFIARLVLLFAAG